MAILSVTSAAALLPLAWILGGIIAGVAAYVLILRRLSAGSAAIAGVVILWGALAGLYVGLDHIPLSGRNAVLLNRSIGALFVLSLTWIAARLAGASIARFGRRTEHRLFSVSLYSTLVQSAIFIIGLLTVLSSLGIAIAPLLTTLGLGGLAVALALNDTLTNLFAGVHIVAARQIRVGDYVSFDFAQGMVTDIKWHNTTIRDLDHNVIVIPNAKVNTSVFTNYSTSAGDIVSAVSATLAWKGTYTKLETLARECARAVIEDTAGSVNAHACGVVLTALNETNLQITAYLPIGHIENRRRASGEFLRRLHDAALAAGMGAS